MKLEIVDTVTSVLPEVSINSSATLEDVEVNFSPVWKLPTTVVRTSDVPVLSLCTNPYAPEFAPVTFAPVTIPPAAPPAGVPLIVIFVNILKSNI